MDLKESISEIIPRARSWVKEQCLYVETFGSALDRTGLRIARVVGVARPERIRWLRRERIPLPEDVLLREAAIETGLLGPDMLAMTVGYSIILKGHAINYRVLAHECRHVHQFETLGTIDEYISAYLLQVVEYGYEDAPMEQDARMAESVSVFFRPADCQPV